MKYSVSDMEKLAQDFGFKFLSNEYKGIIKKHRWKCPCGHIWMARPNNIKNGTGCPKCSHSKLRRTIKDAIKIGEKKGFTLMSTKFVGMKRKHLWKCRDGHEWMATPESIKRTNCPKCSGGIQEERSRFVFESLLKNRFPKNRKVLNGLELDGYCDDLNLAFEYNGEQHYKNHFFNKKCGISIAKRDKQKSDLCKKLGIKKIDIPYTENDNLEKFIRQELNKIGVKITGKVDWSKFNGKFSRFNHLIQIATSRNGKLLSKMYLGSHKKHDFYCEICKTKWKATAKDVINGSWCPKCANNQKYTKKEISAIALKMGFLFLSSDYLGMNSPHLFRCTNCNAKWMVKPNRIQQGAKCPSCKTGGE